jgi:hypothetical protein
LNHSQADSGIPLDSIRSEFALVPPEAAALRAVLDFKVQLRSGSASR